MKLMWGGGILESHEVLKNDPVVGLRPCELRHDHTLLLDICQCGTNKNLRSWDPSKPAKFLSQPG